MENENVSSISAISSARQSNFHSIAKIIIWASILN
jgi:hypothetical protein